MALGGLWRNGGGLVGRRGMGTSSGGGENLGLEGEGECGEHLRGQNWSREVSGKAKRL